MNSFGNAGTEPQRPGSFTARIVPIVAGLAAIGSTYVVATTASGSLKTALVTGVAFLFVLSCILTNRPRAAHYKAESEADGIKKSSFEEIEDRLIALDEANEFFGTSLNAADMFRLVSSRVSEILPFAGCALAVPDEFGQKLRYVHFDGGNSEAMLDVETAVTDSLAGHAFRRGRIEIDNKLEKDMAALGSERLIGFVSTAAIPLIQGETPFGVFQLFFSERIKHNEDTMKLLEAIGEHVMPIFRSSLAFERSLSSALTDTLTGLPNERAFYMVLENQLAESMRHRDDRPLTILSIDIRDFGAVNSMLGHTVGDQMLEFVGMHIGEHLRKMDFLARTVNDEFSVILPTASEKTAFEIIERIREGFVQNEFEISEGEGVAIALNIGWATFWKDGETADQLIRAAHQRKRQAKCEQPSGVLWFPKEYVN